MKTKFFITRFKQRIRPKTDAVERGSPVEVGAGDTSGFSRQGDNISLLYLVSLFDIDFVEMSVDGGEVMSVFQNDYIAGIK